MRRILFGAVAVAAVLAVNGCAVGIDEDRPRLETGPIPVGAISGLSGPVAFPETVRAVRAVFDQVNRDGGIRGRPLKYLVEDDKTDPEQAKTAARKLVEDEGVVALVGSSSVLECTVNGPYYQQKEILSIPGHGADPGCYTNSNISPVNAGVFQSATASMLYASKNLGRQRVCALFAAFPGWGPAYQEAVRRFEQISGRSLVLLDATVPPTPQADPAPYIAKIREARCQAVVYNAIEATAVSMLRAAKAAGVDGVDWVMLSPVFTAKAAADLGADGEGLYVNAEFEPYNTDAPALGDWKKVMQAAKVPLNTFSQGGYLAANYLVEALLSIQGHVTRDSVTRAIDRLDSVRNPMTGVPYSFAPADRHNSNRSSKFVQLQAGRWVTVSKNWIVLPEQKRTTTAR